MLFYHAKCCNINHRSSENFKKLGEDWNCETCIKKAKINLIDAKTKCGKQKRTIAKNKIIINCIECNKFYHTNFPC